MKKLIFCCVLTTAAVTAGAATPLWMRNVKISPDGKTIAFTYKGDIFKVSATGGKATRLTTQSSYETTPIWSPDSKKIAFASDRHGNFDIYLMDAEGGQAKRLTTNSAKETPEAFSPDGSKIYYSAAIQMPTASAMFPSVRMTQLYSVSVDGGSPVQELGTPVQKISFFPDGKSFVYQDIKGFENEWRKHHTSSVTRDIWAYDATSGQHRNLTARAGEDRDPVLSTDGQTLYFLAEMPGKSFNLYSAPIADPAKMTALTDFSVHPVRFLSRSNDGKFAFTYDGEIYTLTATGKPEKLEVDVTLDEESQLTRLNIGRAGWGVPSPNGEQIAFIYRGDIFVSSVEHSSTKQITTSPAAESSVTWGSDGRSLIFTSMRDGHFNIYEASIAREDDPNFSNATRISEKPVIAADDIERTNPEYSPDGKLMAFIQDRHKLMVMDTKTKQVRQLTDGSTYPMTNGSFYYTWSPDSKWIAIEDYNNHHTPYSDIALINVETGEMSKITNSGYIDYNPRFVMEGNAILFLSERYGMRSHASWGSQFDVMIAFLNRDAYDKYRLSKEDYELRKELEKQKAKKDKSKSDDDKKGKKSKKSKKSKDTDSDTESDDKPKTISVELEGIENRIERITPYSSDLGDAFITSDGETLYYLSSIEDGYDLWKMDLRDGEPEIASKLGASSASFAFTDDDDVVFIVGDKMRKLKVGSDKITNISVSGSMLLDLAAEREAMFNQVYLSEREMFYTPDLHGVDWDGMAAAYRKFLPHINNNYDFAEMLSEMLGELNVSHTGASAYSTEANNVIDRTATLGLLYDMTYDGDGLKVEEIITGGPFDNAWTQLKPGYVIEKINDVPLSADADIAVLLNNLAGKKTLVSIYDPASGKHLEEVIIPISSGMQSSLLYDRWVKKRAADVDRWSNGRLGYVHIASMNDKSYRDIYSDLLGKYIDREGVVIDIRWNGGGRLHEDIEVLFSGEKYISQVIRNVETCDMPSRRWNKPSIMVQSEACYSNAHGTPWVYKYKGLGKLVGMPVPGTMTSVNWVMLQNPDIVFGIPVVGMRINDGTYLENQQLEPDIKVANDPATIVKGEDAQLRAAVEELLREIDAKKE